MWLLILLSVHKILPIHIKMYPVLKVHLKYLVHNVFPEIPFQLIFPSAEVLQSVLCNSLMVCISLSLFFPHTSTFSLQLLGYICLKGIFFGDLCRYIFFKVRGQAPSNTLYLQLSLGKMLLEWFSSVKRKCLGNHCPPVQPWGNSWSVPLQILDYGILAPFPGRRLWRTTLR